MARYRFFAILYAAFTGGACVTALSLQSPIERGAFVLAAVGMACFTLIFFKASRRDASDAR